MATSGDHSAASASQMPMVPPREVLDERPRNRSSLNEGSEAPAAAPLWADVPADILGNVLRLLPCLADRASVRSVCRHWRAAARVQILPASLPVLVLPRFRFFCLTSDGALIAARRARMPVEVAGDDVRVVGSFDDWLMAVRPSRETDGKSFLVNAITSEVGLNTMNDDVAFYQEKLYLASKTRPIIFAFELIEDENGVSLSCPQRYRFDLLITPSNPTDRKRCNMVVWRGKLLLIIRFFSESTYKKMECKPDSVEVFALDFSTSPCGFTQTHNLDGDCIFVDTYGCRPFATSLNVGVQGDLIYFSVDGINDRFPYVYNVREGSVSRFAAGLPQGSIGFLIWIFPSS